MSHATDLQAQVHELRVDRNADYLEIGRLLTVIRDGQLYRDMDPPFKRWGLYLMSERMSFEWADKAMLAWERVSKIESLVSARDFETFMGLLLAMPFTGMTVLLWGLSDPTALYNAIHKDRVHTWNVRDIRDYVRKGHKRPIQRRDLSVTKTEAETLLRSMHRELKVLKTAKKSKAVIGSCEALLDRVARLVKGFRED